MRFFAKILPRKLKEKYMENAKYARIKDGERVIGISIFSGLILSLVAGFISWRFLSPLISLAVLLLVFLFVGVFFYYSLSLKADNVSKKIEEVLPDALQLMASNLRAGMTTEKALLLSSREEFGELKFEIDRVGREIATGKGIVGALKSMADRFKSEKLKKSVQLINSGLSSGGELASLLEQISANLRESEFIEKKVRSNVLMYVIFIFVSVAVGAPGMFGLSSFLIEVLTTQLAGITTPTGAGGASQLPITLSAVSVSTKFIMSYLIVMLTMTSLLGGLILGLISKGEEKEGIKFIPFLLLTSFVIFFGVRYLVRNFLSGFFGI